jgi:hypothetical protein
MIFPIVFQRLRLLPSAWLRCFSRGLGSVSGLFCLALLQTVAAEAAAPAVVFTNLPAYGANGNLAGLVLNADPSTNSILVFIYVAGDWYSQPNCANQLTPIQPDGSWSADISSSSNDKYATEIAAFLVPSSYSQACVNGIPGLTIPASAEAVVYVNRAAPTARKLDFAGYGWSAKTSNGALAGPGPNYFSDSTNNVFVDGAGALHLWITYTNSTWPCAEIISDRSFGYGQYRFTVQADVNALDPSAVLGMFTYSDDSAYNDREIDLELSHWNYAFGPSNVEDYAIAPYNNGQLVRFPLSLGITNSTHSLIWQSNSVAFQTLNGNFTAQPASSNLLENFTATTGIPPAGGEQIHINLWLNKGNAPVNAQPVEAVLSQFEFVPLGPPPPAQLLQVSPLPGGGAQLTVQGQLDWHYDILTSTNLVNWSSLATVIATNNLFIFNDTNPPAAAVPILI